MIETHHEEIKLNDPNLDIIDDMKKELSPQRSSVISDSPLRRTSFNEFAENNSRNASIISNPARINGSMGLKTSQILSTSKDDLGDDDESPTSGQIKRMRRKNMEKDIAARRSFKNAREE